MEAKAIAKTVRITPRKVRLVVDLVRGKNIAEAASILRLTPRGASAVVDKVLKSATANAVNNLKLEQSKLFVKEAYVNEGPTMKRFLPRAKGSAAPILKRTSHITIVVAVKE
ncbi:MAG: 50S ribosomal protein L22 [Bacilli bacterium]|jgi:large subunit ribosomal protein L22|nr:50S ribosomal protein L22 [Bacilli bacterium]